MLYIHSCYYIKLYNICSCVLLKPFIINNELHLERDQIFNLLETIQAYVHIVQAIHHVIDEIHTSIKKN